MSTTGHAATVRVLNAASRRAAERAINASAGGNDLLAHTHNIELLREHMRHQLPDPDGRQRYARSQRTIAHLRERIAQLKEETT